MNPYLKGRKLVVVNVKCLRITQKMIILNDLTYNTIFNSLIGFKSTFLYNLYIFLYSI